MCIEKVIAYKQPAEWTGALAIGFTTCQPSYYEKRLPEQILSIPNSWCAGYTGEVTESARAWRYSPVQT